MTTTLAAVSTTKASEQVLEMAPATVERKMEIVAMPPGFAAAETRPVVYIGGSEEGGLPFYEWNFDEERKDYVPVNRFSARLMDIKTIVKNADDDIKRTVKLVLEFETASGGRVAISCGAKTYSALGIVSGLSGMSSEQLAGEIGLSGKVGRRGVTFVNTFAQGGLVRHPDSEELLKESRKDDAQVECIEGLIGEIKRKLS